MKAATRSAVVGALFLFTLAGGWLTAGTAQAAPRIVNVQYEFVPGESGDTKTRRMVKRRITKFDQYLKSPSHEVFYVNWESGEGLSAGSTVVFEYRQGRSRVSKVVKFTYPSAVNGAKRTTFNIPLGSTSGGGRVSAWRVRLTHNQQVLSTRVSPDWSAR